MKYKFSVLYNGIHHSYSLNFRSNCLVFYLKDNFIFYVFKEHNHRYYFRCFFYNDLLIYCSPYFSSKKDLYCAIQNLLQEKLYHVIQYF